LLSFIFCTILDTLNQVFFLCGYVTNPNSFPQPLSSDEEHKYIESYKNGNEEARNILIERNLRLVAHIAKKFNTFTCDNDDLISIGTIGLIKAISAYDQMKGIRLATFAAKCIENEILMHIRSSKKTQNEVSLHDPIGLDKEGNEIMLIDIMENESTSIIDQVELKMQVHHLYNKMKTVLMKREKLILELRYGLSMNNLKTQHEIAEILGISRSYVSRIEKKAIKKLRKYIKQDL